MVTPLVGAVTPASGFIESVLIDTIPLRYSARCAQSVDETDTPRASRHPVLTHRIVATETCKSAAGVFRPTDNGGIKQHRRAPDKHRNDGSPDGRIHLYIFCSGAPHAVFSRGSATVFITDASTSTEPAP